MGEKTFCPFHKNFSTAIPCFHLPRCEPKARRRTLSYTKTYKSEVNRNKEIEISQKSSYRDNLLPKIVVGAMNKPTLLLANY